MLYQFDGSLCADGQGTPLHTELSTLDEQMNRQMYPKAGPAAVVKIAWKGRLAGT